MSLPALINHSFDPVAVFNSIIQQAVGGSVSSLLQQINVSLPLQQGSFNLDTLQLTNPSNLFGSVPTNNISSTQDMSRVPPKQQLIHLGQKYGVPYSGQDINKYQKVVIKTVLVKKAHQMGIPENVALGMSGNESGWKMWKDVNTGVPVQGKNIRSGVLKSTDWGAMQINDKAHAKAGERVKYDLEYNIDYGLKFLAGRRKKIQGSLNLGFGDWDRTIASYNLGHNPKTERSYQIAQKYVGGVKKRSMQA